MTAGELRRKLAGYPADMPVVVCGGGGNEFDGLRSCNVMTMVPTGSPRGQFEVLISAGDKRARIRAACLYG